MRTRGISGKIATLTAASLGLWAAGIGAQTAPDYYPDPTWPKPLPNNWKFGGITGLAVDADSNVWVLNRPNDLADMELLAELSPPVSECCTRPPSMLHFDRSGNVIGWFDPAQGHGMDVDDEGFVYIGQDTVRKYDPRTGEILAEVARTPEREGGGQVGLPPPAERVPGQGTLEHAEVFMPSSPPDAERRAERAAAAAAFREKYPPGTPTVVGGIEEIRIVEADNEMYVADNYLGGRVLVYDLDTFEFKRGWGAYGKPLADISTDDADHRYVPNGPMPRDFAGHLTLNVSNDGRVYAADRRANRIHVTTRAGGFLQEFVLAPGTGGGGSTGGVAFLARPRAAISLHLRPHEQQDLVAQPRGWRSRGRTGQHGRSRRAVFRPAHDRRGFGRLHLHRRSRLLPGAAVRAVDHAEGAVASTTVRTAIVPNRLRCSWPV